MIRNSLSLGIRNFSFDRCFGGVDSVDPFLTEFQTVAAGPCGSACGSALYATLTRRRISPGTAHQFGKQYSRFRGVGAVQRGKWHRCVESNTLYLSFSQCAEAAMKCPRPAIKAEIGQLNAEVVKLR